MKFLFSAVLVLSTCSLFAGKDPLSPEKDCFTSNSVLIIKTVKLSNSNMLVQRPAMNLSGVSRNSTPQAFNIFAWDGRIRFTLGKNMVLALTYN